MTKAEYIERYGEDAYREYRRRCKAYYEANKSKILKKQKVYRKANKEKVTDYAKDYRERNKEKISEYHKANYEKNKADIKAYREKNKERILAYQKVYRKVNKKNIAIKKKAYLNTKKGRAFMLLRNYIREDKTRNRGECTLTAEWIIENIFSGQVCHWCGESAWEKLGCDRINNDLPHTPENVVCSCDDCNVDRGKKTYDEYRRLLQRKTKNSL